MKLVLLRKFRNYIMNDNNQTMDIAQDNNLSVRLNDIRTVTVHVHHMHKCTFLNQRNVHRALNWRKLTLQITI